MTNVLVFKREGCRCKQNASCFPFLTFLSACIAIRVHGRHDVNTSVVDQLGDLRVCSVVATKVLDEVEQELSAHNFVAVHVADVLELWLACQDTTQRDFVMFFFFFYEKVKNKNHFIRMHSVPCS